MDKWGSSCLKLQAIISNNEHKRVGNEWKKVGGKLINYFYFGMNIIRGNILLENISDKTQSINHKTNKFPMNALLQMSTSIWVLIVDFLVSSCKQTQTHTHTHTKDICLFILIIIEHTYNHVIKFMMKMSMKMNCNCNTVCLDDVCWWKAYANLPESLDLFYDYILHSTQTHTNHSFKLFWSMNNCAYQIASLHEEMWLL